MNMLFISFVLIDFFFPSLLSSIGKQNKYWSQEYILYLGEVRESMVEEAFARR